MEKDYVKWNELKQKLNAENNVPFYKEREVWWCSIGINIGHEENGKNDESSRPILVVKKFNKRLLWGIP